MLHPDLNYCCLTSRSVTFSIDSASQQQPAIAVGVHKRLALVNGISTTVLQVELQPFVGVITERLLSANCFRNAL